MKIWVDDVRPAPDGFVWMRSVNQVKNFILSLESYEDGSLDELDFDWLDEYDGPLTLIDLDHDAGDYACDGGDYIKILDWMEATGRNYPIHIHTANPVGFWNMMAIADRNNWEVEKWPCYC